MQPLVGKALAGRNSLITGNQIFSLEPDTQTAVYVKSSVLFSSESTPDDCNFLILFISKYKSVKVQGKITAIDCDRSSRSHLFFFRDLVPCSFPVKICDKDIQFPVIIEMRSEINIKDDNLFDLAL